MSIKDAVTVKGDRERYVAVTFNHHVYDAPERAVFVSLGNDSTYYLNEYEVISIEQAKELRAKLDEIIVEFEANKPSLVDKALEFLNGLSVGSIVRFGPDAPGDSWASWIKRTETEWEVIDSLRPGFIGEKRDVARFFKFTEPTTLPTLIFNSNTEVIF
jgi:hypothetical protein